MWNEIIILQYFITVNFFGLKQRNLHKCRQVYKHISMFFIRTVKSNMAA